ncbi:uncharacterized protein TRAVEDRAFT_66356 [Trametes versicolor FP-101664 SS1]|uniref:uncharacterized protein n=1 Tax=Trametes versicolor (strain FP-101664) TaxID=717944 RepID=UPI00046231C9|nr:uncharacterized protein TRAVEDRAFT_66356 [Trametes versicolor FP-101664 SS1]EIW54824.1 hypothetical protein TRAVEDRAFT_66356 [Trametes versicolor FP-101664 SS1]
MPQIEPFTKAKEPWHSDPSYHAILSSRSTGGDMVTGSSDTGKSGGHPDPITGSSGGGQPTHTQTSPVVAALVAVAILFVASVLGWWIVSRIRRSRRGASVSPMDARDAKPILSDVVLGSPSASKYIYTAKWDRLSPVSVDYASKLDQKRWESLSQLAKDDASLSTSSSHSSQTRPKSFSMFSRASSPAAMVSPDPEPIEFRVAMVIAMPSQRGPQGSGELCLGVTYSPLL